MKDKTLLAVLLHSLAAVGLLLFVASTVRSVLTARSTKHATLVTSIAVQPEQQNGLTVAQPYCSGDVGRLPAHAWLQTVASSSGYAVLSSVLENLFTHYGMIPSKWRTPDEQGIAKHWKLIQVPTVTASLQSAVERLQQATDKPFIAIISRSYHADELQNLLQQPVLRLTFVHKQHAAAAAAAVRQVEVTDEQYKFEFDNTVDRYSSKTYDFVFVEERMNEALVVFMLEYGLLLEDIVYLNTTTTTSTRTAPLDNNTYIRSSNISNNPTAEELSSFWHKANKQLDMRIARLQRRCGPDTVSSALQTFEQLLHHVSLECSDVTGWSTHQPWTFSRAAGTGSNTAAVARPCGLTNSSIRCEQQQQLIRRCTRQVTRRLMTQEQHKSRPLTS